MTKIYRKINENGDYREEDDTGILDWLFEIFS